ncbi:hypothetical protein QQF64_026349 [Cirrhinus molitorella]|uniref:Uncharacterized protein n=1 Tax=Cirrhinus molitorella TaxID=172907 RepID=A0ABR3N9Y5_9TELE
MVQHISKTYVTSICCFFSAGPSHKGKMSWSDAVSTRCSEVVYATASRIRSFISSDNNEQLIRSTQSLHHCVNRYFTITNDLLNIINTHFGENYSLISADESKSIKENCAIVREAMSIILELSKREEKKIRGIIEPDIYDKIAFTGVPLKDKAALIKNFHADQLGVFGSVLLPLVAIQLARSDLEIVKPPNEELDLPVLSLKLGDLLKSSKSITKLLFERESQQTNHTQIVEDAISVLKPLCDAYNHIAGEVQAYVGIVSENIESHH